MVLLLLYGLRARPTATPERKQVVSSHSDEPGRDAECCFNSGRQRAEAWAVTAPRNTRRVRGRHSRLLKRTFRFIRLSFVLVVHLPSRQPVSLRV
jgi:hypothetical protein